MQLAMNSEKSLSASAQFIAIRSIMRHFLSMRLFKRTRHASIQTSAVDHCRRPCLCCCPYALGLCSHIDHWLNRRAGCRSIGKENEGGARQDLHAGSGCFPRQRHLLFDDNVRSRLYISDTIAVNGRLPLKEEAPRGVAKGFTWGAGAATILRNGEPQPLTSPQALSVEKSPAMCVCTTRP